MEIVQMEGPSYTQQYDAKLTKDELSEVKLISW